MPKKQPNEHMHNTINLNSSAYLVNSRTGGDFYPDMAMLKKSI